MPTMPGTPAIPELPELANRVCCLYRVSTTKQVDIDEQNQADIPVQRKACRDYAEKMGWVIVKEEKEAGVSGFKVSANDRDKIQLIKEYAEKGLFDILLVFMFDRLGRRSEETPFLLEWFVKHGIRVWSVNEGEQRIDSHADRLMNYIRFWQADGESQKTALRTKAALGQMVQEGRFRGGIAPYGYSLVPSGIYNKRKHEVNKLVINEEEARVVRMMFDLCVGSGYGRFQIARFLNESEFRTRDGTNWHESTVGHILHNVMYVGILRSGETQSEIFEELQIISPNTFQMAKDLMEQRINERDPERTMPKRINGQSLLSGNVFCGHCGGRLTLTTNTTCRKDANGVRVRRDRIRYVCYNKTRKRAECGGPTGYTMHLLDEMIVEILHRVFDKMQNASVEDIIRKTEESTVAQLNERLSAARMECAKATKEYESLKTEVAKAVLGQSEFPKELLKELVEKARERLLEADATLRSLTEESEDTERRIAAIRAKYDQVISWAKIFDTSDRAVQKMIAGYIIRRVYVYRDYRLKVEFNMDYAQYVYGLDIPNDFAVDALVS